MQRASSESKIFFSEEEDVFDVKTNLLEKGNASNVDRPQERVSGWRKTLKPALLHGLLVAINLTIAGILLHTLRHQHKGNDLFYSPISDIIEYELRNFTNDDIPRYMGPPDPAREKAWHDMLQGIDVRITKDDLIKMGRLENAVELNDENGGYVVLVNAYHELHCLKLIRQNLYLDHFYPNETEADAKERLHHIDHCLNYLRQAAMCHGDVGMSTWHWEAGSRMPQGHTTPHVCRNWNAIDSWSKQRKVNIYQPGLLVSPEFGVTFPHGVGSKKNPPSDGGE
ncbi:Transacylase cctO-like protein [Cladobotryum mycophilum]|uniref:Transacylase cctO-like protein n=1 Tax=Cladobotryum mycophilum TaxID=491253 RepID=A0ABR0SPX2_9HYPO